MTDRAFAISLGDSQTIYATPDPQDQDQLTELFGDGPMQLRGADGDVEGHALSSDVLVDVEGHAIALRLPTPADAAALRKALTVGAVTATLVAAGAIASLQSPTAPATTVDVPRSAVTQQAPAQSVRADEAQSLREQGYANAQAAAQSAAIAESRGEVVTGEMKSDAMREQANANSQAGSQTAPSTVTNVNPAPALAAIPAPAQHADQAEQIREKAYNQDN